MSLPVTLLPAATYEVGPHGFGPAAIPVGDDTATISLDRSVWANAISRVALSVDVSLDGGQTWNSPYPDALPFPIALEAVGGPALDKNGVLYTATTYSVGLPSPNNPNRMLRGVITVAGGQVQTGVSLTSLVAASVGQTAVGA